MLTKLRSLFYGWWIVIASFFLLLVCGGTALYGFSAFFDPIYQEMGWSRAETSIAFSLRSVEGGIVQPSSGFSLTVSGQGNAFLSAFFSWVLPSSLSAVSPAC